MSAADLDALRRRLLEHHPDPGEADGLYTLSLDWPERWAIGRLPEPFFDWGHPARGTRRVGLGIAWSAEVQGPDRLARLHADFARLTATWRHAGPGAPVGAFCAFAFGDQPATQGAWTGLPAGLLAVPEVVLERGADGGARLCLSAPPAACRDWPRQVEAWLTRIATLFEPSEPDHAYNPLHRLPEAMPTSDWLALVEAAKIEIATGHLDKVVLARQVSFEADRPFAIGVVLDRLARDFPDCRVVGVGLAGRTLVAATPERLVALRAGIARCDALGGTGEVIDGLTQDDKTRREHALVVEHITRILHGSADQVIVPPAPGVMTLGRMHHLWSPVEAHGAVGPLLALAARLHPTPAVAGMPATAAGEWIARHEGFDRGWYSGGIGWLEADGDGELAVLLRCALLSGTRADLFAGAGIVSGSDPQAELAETEWKLGAVAGALVGQMATH